MPKIRQLIFLVVIVSLLVVFTGCEVPEDRFGWLGGGGPAEGAPHSNFVSAYHILRVKAGQAIPIESYHLTRAGKLGKLEIFVNDQPVTSEQVRPDAAFPDTLATLQVLERGRAAQPAFSLLEFPAPACRRLLITGGPANAHLIEREFPASYWTVCHVWIGHIPGTYDLSLRATDLDNRPGETITQRIEVFKAS
ncbi:MAG: hypothetical protein AB1801_23090 [Chloroflexota bacterium]